jgi:hypothetical protein
MLDDETNFFFWIYKKKKNKLNNNPLNHRHEFNWKAQLLTNLMLKDKIETKNKKYFKVKK